MSFVTIPSPLRACSVRNGLRASPLRAGSPTGRASRRFAFARHGHAPTTSFGLALTVKNGGCGTALALPASRQTRPCLLGVGFPPSGPRVWTCTSWTWFMPITHAAQSVLRPLCLLSGLAADWHVRRAKPGGPINPAAYARSKDRNRPSRCFRLHYSRSTLPFRGLSRWPVFRFREMSQTLLAYEPREAFSKRGSPS